MAEKRFPVKIFHKREIDTELTEGGGDSKPPKWVLTGNDLHTHANELYEKFFEIQDNFTQAQKDSDIPVSVEVKLNEKALAKSYRRNVEKLLSDQHGNVNSVGFSPDDQWMFYFRTSDHLKQVTNRLKTPDKNAREISSIDEIRPFKPHIEKTADIKRDYKAKLIDYQNNQDNKKIAKLFKQLCEDQGIKLQQKQYTNTLEIFKLSDITYDSFDTISHFEGLFSIEPMPFFDTNFDGSEYTRSINAKKPNPDIEYPIIGILDSGIEKNRYLKDWVIDSYKVYEDSYLDTSHGTFVAGIVVYGNELIGENQPNIGCKIFDAAVYPDIKKGGRIPEDELVDNIKDVIKLYADKIKVWSLSLGTQREIDDKRFSDFGKTLDYLQDQHNIIIVKSAGNCDNFIKNLPKKRISVSADSVRSVVVGSIAHNKSLHDIADINYPSPFSRTGPGPAHIIKPDLVEYGGNAGLDSSGSLKANGVLSFSKQGGLTTAVGTSFSTPRIATSLAMINHNLIGDFNPLLMKTLLIHKSSHPSNVQMPVHDKLNEMGFGRPPEIEDILHNSPDEITLIMQDVLPSGNYIHILDFPYPVDLIDQNGFYFGEITITLVNHPIVDINHGSEYCQSDLSISFGTYDQKKKRDTSQPTIKNPTGKLNPGSLLTDSMFSKKKKSEGIGRNNSERILIKNGKYHPTKKFLVNLEDLTDGKKEKHLKAPKKWFLRIDGLYRRAIEQKYEANRSLLKQKFCLAITIKDPTRKSRKVYDQVISMLDQFQFVHENIQLNQSIQLRHSV